MSDAKMMHLQLNSLLRLIRIFSMCTNYQVWKLCFIIVINA